MITALPLLLARRAAAAVDQTAQAMGLFADPCRAEIGVPAGTLAASAAAHVSLDALRQDPDIGSRSAGEKLETRFEADVTVHLLGPGAVDLSGAQRDPADAPVVGRDLMLTVVLDRLTASDETGGAAEDSATTLSGGRRLSARWRLDGLRGISPDLVDSRDIWRIETTFRGVQTLSEVPAEGGHILRIEMDGRTPQRMLEARIDATADDLPLSMVTGLGPDLANRLAAEGLVRFADLTRVPNTGIAALADGIAPDGAPVNATLKLMHLILGIRRNVVLAGVNAAFLDERFAELPLSAVWDGTTYTPPVDMPPDQLLRMQILAEPLMPFLRAEDWDRITLGQLSTAKGEP